jgi:hypothetical protein
MLTYRAAVWLVAAELLGRYASSSDTVTARPSGQM